MSNLSPLAIVALTAGLSLVPVFLWGLIFLSKSEEKRYMIVRTFMIGAIMVVPLVFYRSLWELFPSIDLAKNLEPLGNLGISFAGLTLNLIALYVSIGIIEEYLKNLVVRKVDTKEINSVKDSIEFSIIAALGFSFAENTFYFIQVYQSLGLEMLWKVFVFRALFSTFAHTLFSAVYGYHFGLALFAKDVYRKAKENSVLTAPIYYLYKLISKKSKADIFEEKHKFLGLFYAALLHSVFNLLLEAKTTVFLVPFLLIGVVHVSYMIYNKDNYIKYN
jgi:RsiW-degrading membrane proteinase PrsW (M82 family)